MLETIGLIGSTLLVLSGFFQLIKTIGEGKAEGISVIFLVIMINGFVLMTIYTLRKVGFDGPLLGNYLSAILVWSIVLKYKLYPRK